MHLYGAIQIPIESCLPVTQDSTGEHWIAGSAQSTVGINF